MSKFSTVICASLFFLLIFAGCSGRLKDTMAVPDLSSIRAEAGKARGEGHSIFIDSFADSRLSPELARKEEQKITASGDVALGVSTALQRAFSSRGFSITESAPVVVNGEVREWVAQISKGMPGKVEAQAKVYIEVLDPANKRIYSGTYQGNASREQPGVKMETVSLTLGTAMSEALSQVLADSQLMDLLISY